MDASVKYIEKRSPWWLLTKRCSQKCYFQKNDAYCT